MMKKSVKKKWLKALRSGEYSQTSGTLRRKSNDGVTSFCCLGVLCNIHAQEHPEIAAKETNPEVYLKSSALLPIEVAEWAGLTKDFIGGDPNGAAVDIGVTYRDRFTTLAALNDDEGLSFKEIANVIERCL